MDTKEIIIDLNDSMYAHGFQSGNQLHAENFEKCIELIKSQLQKAIKADPQKNDGVVLNHDYDTIGVFGERGSGKTSFMVSLLEKCQKDLPDAQVLRLIDPTLVEHKKPMVLCVLAMINQLVKEKLKSLECSSGTTVASQRSGWEKTLRNIATGIIAIETVGQKTYDDKLWHDEDYVMRTGFNKVEKTNEFERYIRELLGLALSILDKKSFILAFDDIDIDVAQGWEVLETIRKYFSDSRIITIVSGNLKLYGMIVRDKLSKDLSLNSRNKEMMANELESQYMLKLIRPEKRFNLFPLKILLNMGNIISFSEKGVKKTPDDTYKEILEKFGIKDTPSQKTFIDFLESMSLRSQLNFVKEMWLVPEKESESKNSKPSLYVFSSRIYAAGIDWELLKSNPKVLNIAILDYLVSNENLPDSYLLLPTLADKDMNSNFVAFTFLECSNFKDSPYLCFDYMLRIGYLRNLMLPITDHDKITDLIKYAGWNQIMSLKNNIGLTMAFLSAHSGNGLKEHISLYGLEKTVKAGKEKAGDAIDKILKEHDDDMTKLLAMFPFMKIANSSNNQSNNYYSIFALLAIITETLKCKTPDELKGVLNDLKLFRTYFGPNEGEVNADEVEIELDLDIPAETIDTLAERIEKWKNDSPNEPLPPYIFGRIATRLYYAVLNAKGKSVGDLMNIMVCAFINACIIEEGKVALTNAEQTQLNNNNPRNDTKILIDNLKKSAIINKLKFSKWMAESPLISCFVSEDVYVELKKYFIPDLASLEQIKVYDLLSRIKSKSTDSDKYKFSGAKGEWENTLNILKENGISEETIRTEILGKRPEEAKDFIDGLDIFQFVTKNSVQKFKSYMRPDDAGIGNDEEGRTHTGPMDEESQQESSKPEVSDNTTENGANAKS